MGGIGVLFRFDKAPADPSRLEALHRALWDRIDTHLRNALVEEVTRTILVHYISEQKYHWYGDDGTTSFFGEGVCFTFRDGGDDFPMKYASYHWTDRACSDPAVFADLQAIARRFDAELHPRALSPPETIYFHLDGALVAIEDEYLDVWTNAGLVRVDFAECPFLDFVEQLVSEKRCLCEICRKPSDESDGPSFDAERLAGIPWYVEVADAPAEFPRLLAALEAALQESDADLPVDLLDQIATLTGLARRKAELLIALRLDDDVDDARVPAALVQLGARWAAPVLFAPFLDKRTAYDTRETLREAVRTLLARPKQPVVTSGELVDADGVPILVLHFVGEYVGEADAPPMRAATDALLAAHPAAQGIVLDATELSYTKGKGLDRVVQRGRPRVWARSSLSQGLHHFIKKERGLLPEEWLAPSLEEAIAAVRARVVADAYEIHAADGGILETVRREPRGRRHLLRLDEDGQAVDGEILHNLCGETIEIVRKWPSGAVTVEESPVRDAQGKDNEACVVGGELYRRNGTVYKVDFNPLLRKQPMPANWVDQVAARPTITRVSLDFTDVPTTEILRLLERCPQLVELYLNRRRLDAELFTSPLLGKLRLVQLHDIEAPPGSVGRLAALHPWLVIEPTPGFETSGRCVDADGVAILVVSFAGYYDAENAAKMKRACEALLTEHPDVQGIVLDATSLSYTSGKELADVLAEGRPFAWAVSASSRGLFRWVREEQSLEPREWLFPSLDAAIAAVRAQVVADQYEVHASNGVVWYTWRREPRGRRKSSVREINGVSLHDETLFDLRGRVIEDLFRKMDGSLERVFEFPIRDAAGGENDACRLGAKLFSLEGRLLTIDFNPAVTHLPLPADWIDRVAAHPTVTTVVLDGTGVATGALLRLLERCPQLERLWLNGLQLEADFFASSLLANLKVISMWNTTAPTGAAKQLVMRYPTIEIQPASALEG